MKILIHLIAESGVGQHMQEIACLERKEHCLEDVGLTLPSWRNTWKLNVVARTVAEPEG